LLTPRLACAALAPFCTPLLIAQSDWTVYGHDAGQTKHSPLDEITVKNIGKLRQAWVYHMAPASQANDLRASAAGNRHPLTTQATPLIGNRLIFLVTPYGSVIALKPETGDLTLTLDPLTIGKPHPVPGEDTNEIEEVWTARDGKSLALVGNQLGWQTPGMAYLHIPDNQNPHTNINSGPDSQARFLYFARCRSHELRK